MGTSYPSTPTPVDQRRWDEAKLFLMGSPVDLVGCYQERIEYPDKTRLFPVAVVRCPEHGTTEVLLSNLRKKQHPCQPCSYIIRGRTKQNTHASVERVQTIFPLDRIERDLTAKPGQCRVRGVCHKCGQPFVRVRAKDLLKGQGPCEPCGKRGRWITEMTNDREAGGTRWSETYTGYLTLLRDETHVKFGIGSRTRARIHGEPLLLVRGKRLNVLLWEQDCLVGTTPADPDVAKALVAHGGYTEVRQDPAVMVLLGLCAADRYDLQVSHNTYARLSS